MTNKEIKQFSKNKISGKRKSALAIIAFLLIFSAVFTLLLRAITQFSTRLAENQHLADYKLPIFIASGIIVLVISFFVLCIYSSISVGEKAWYTGLTLSKENYTKRLFFWFKPQFSLKALRFKATLFFIKTAVTTVYVLPAVIILWSAYYLAGSGGIETYFFLALCGGGALLLLSGLIFRFVTVQRYFLAEYLFSSDPRSGVLTAINRSKNLLDGHIFEIVKFKLSFIPWFFGCLFLAPSLYFVPYYKACCSAVAKKITL